MSDDAPPLIAASPSPSDSEVIKPDAVESILADFRSWLQEAQEAPPAAETPSFDLATVVQHFTALRQEVNLQTRASRTQAEQSAQALELLRQAQETIKQQQARLLEAGQQEQEERLRPLLKSLIDVHDALSLARRGVQRLLEPAPPPTLAPPEVRLPFWARWLGLSASIEQQLQQETQATKPTLDALAQRSRQVLDALLVGYDMSLQRIERTLQSQDLETIPCAGLPFDPETMEVVEVTRTEGVVGTQVVEVVRPGYRWNGRLFRYAQVRVAKA